ncbi:sensor histidine kinase [Megalodesulfovibrio paquesii]
MSKPDINRFLHDKFLRVSVLPALVLVLIWVAHDLTSDHSLVDLSSAHGLFLVLLALCLSLAVPYVLMRSALARVKSDVAGLSRLFGSQLDEAGAETARQRMHCQDTADIAASAIRMHRESRQATQALQQSEERFRLAMEASQDGLWDWNVASGEVYFSPGYAAMLGFSPEEAASADLWPGRVHPDDKDAVLAVNMDCIENRVDHFKVQFRMLTKEGEWRWVMGRGRAVTRDAAGRATRMIGTHSDITDRKRAEEACSYAREELEALVIDRTRELARKALELERANQELRAMDELKSGLMSVVSHELRTPLTSIYGFVRLIRRDFSTRFDSCCQGDLELLKRCNRIRGNLDIIETEGRRLGRIINDFLDLSKIESGRIAWNDGPVDVSSLLHRAARLVQPAFESRQTVRLQVEALAQQLTLCVDEDRLVQVLVNLLDNACKYTDRGEVRLAARQDDAMVVLTVADTGCGIANAELEQIFEKFYQSPLHASGGEVTRGTGLGLAICRQIVEHYQGRIWAESEPDLGTVFHVALPLHASACMTAAQLPEATVSSG